MVKRYQKDIHYYSGTFRSLRELLITDTELKLIAAAAIMGDSNNPKIGYNTPAAMGTPTELQMKAKNRF